MALAALPDDVRAALPAIVEELRARAAPAHEDERVLRLGQTVALLGFSGNDDAREAWTLAACDRLAAVPADLFDEALTHAERTSTHLSQVLPAVFEYVGDFPYRRRQRLDRVLTLAKAAGVDA